MSKSNIPKIIRLHKARYSHPNKELRICEVCHRIKPRIIGIYDVKYETRHAFSAALSVFYDNPYYNPNSCICSVRCINKYIKDKIGDIVLQLAEDILPTKADF